MQFTSSDPPDVILIQPKLFIGECVFFLETYRKDRFSAAGIQADCVQDNYSSSTVGILRG